MQAIANTYINYYWLDIINSSYIASYVYYQHKETYLFKTLLSAYIYRDSILLYIVI